MLGFAWLLYPLHTLPLLLRYIDVKKLNQTFTRFIWAGKKPCFALHSLMMTRAKGGLNLRGYKVSCLLWHVLDWISHFSNWELKLDLAYPWLPLSLLHTSYSDLLTQIKSSALLLDTIITWKTVGKFHGLPFLVSKIMPLWGHPEFPQGKDNSMSPQRRGIQVIKNSYTQKMVNPCRDKWTDYFILAPIFLLFSSWRPSVNPDYGTLQNSDHRTSLMTWWISVLMSLMFVSYTRPSNISYWIYYKKGFLKSGREQWEI